MGVGRAHSVVMGGGALVGTQSCGRGKRAWFTWYSPCIVAPGDLGVGQL